MVASKVVNIEEEEVVAKTKIDFEMGKKLSIQDMLKTKLQTQVNNTFQEMYNKY